MTEQEIAVGMKVDPLITDPDFSWTGAVVTKPINKYDRFEVCKGGRTICLLASELFPHVEKPKPLPEPPHTVSVAAHVRAAIQHLKDAEIVLQIERERLENLIK